jgi:hypothetical protein
LGAQLQAPLAVAFCCSMLSKVGMWLLLLLYSICW